MEYKLTVVRVFVTDWTRAPRFYLDTLGMTAVHRSDDWAGCCRTCATPTETS